ncbi:MAG: glycosyltransferase family 4 protein [Patescibacteria group bacterium]
MQKKILIATGIFPPQIGGPATYSFLLSKELPHYGFSVDVVNFGDFLKLPKFIRHIVYFVALFYKGISADMIYAQDPVSVGLPAFFVAKILRKKFYLKIVGDYAWEQGVQRFGVKDRLDVFSTQSQSQYPLFVRILKFIQYHVVCGADKIITPSNYLKNIIINWGIPSHKITLIYNGFDAPTTRVSKKEIREKLGMEYFSILSVGRLVPWKGFSMLIEIIEEISSKIPNAHLYIAGDGPDHELLAEKIKVLKLNNYVTLLGKLTQEDLFEYITASDVFVLNTSYEGFSHQLLEVMALGTPIITTPVGGNIEIIEDKKNGIFVPYDNAELFVRAITELHDKNDFARELSYAAKDKIKEFTNERMLQNLAQQLA